MDRVVVDYAKITVHMNAIIMLSVPTVPFSGPITD